MFPAILNGAIEGALSAAPQYNWGAETNNSSRPVKIGRLPGTINKNNGVGHSAKKTDKVFSRSRTDGIALLREKGGRFVRKDIKPCACEGRDPSPPDTWQRDSVFANENESYHYHRRKEEYLRNARAGAITSIAGTFKGDPNAAAWGIVESLVEMGQYCDVTIDEAIRKNPDLANELQFIRETTDASTSDLPFDRDMRPPNPGLEQELQFVRDTTDASTSDLPFDRDMRPPNPGLEQELQFVRDVTHESTSDLPFDRDMRPPNPGLEQELQFVNDASNSSTEGGEGCVIG